VRNDWKLHVQGKSKWKEIFNSDAEKYWGTGSTFNPDVKVKTTDKDEKWYELNLHLPPLGAVLLK
jgi:1,4-alpha-glucan branching enzyme